MTHGSIVGFAAARRNRARLRTIQERANQDSRRMRQGNEARASCPVCARCELGRRSTGISAHGNGRLRGCRSAESENAYAIPASDIGIRISAFYKKNPRRRWGHGSCKIGEKDNVAPITHEAKRVEKRDYTRVTSVTPSGSEGDNGARSHC